MKTGLRRLVSGWRAQADKRKGRSSRVRVVRGAKIKTRTIRRARLARALGRAPVEVLAGKARLKATDNRRHGGRSGPATFVYAYQEERAPQYIKVFLIAFGSWSPVRWWPPSSGVGGSRQARAPARPRDGPRFERKATDGGYPSGRRRRGGEPGRALRGLLRRP